MRDASAVADAAALHIDSDAYAANTYSMCVYGELPYRDTMHRPGVPDADSYTLRGSGMSDPNSYPLRRSSVSYPNSNPLRRSRVCDPNPNSLHRCGLRDANTHAVPSRRELPNANALH